MGGGFQNQQEHHINIKYEAVHPTAVVVKNLGNLNWLPRGVFVPLGQPYSSLMFGLDQDNSDPNDIFTCKVWTIIFIFLRLDNKLS